MYSLQMKLSKRCSDYEVRVGLILVLRLSSVTRWVKCAPSELSVYDFFFLLMFILPEKKKRKTRLEFYSASCL